MEIQKIEFPPEKEIDRENMYIRKVSGKCEFLAGEGMKLSHSAHVSFDTYFNVFSTEKWLAYTRLDNLAFQFGGTGEFCVRLWQMTEDREERLLRCLIAERQVKAERQNEKGNYVPIPLEKFGKGQIFVEVETTGGEGCRKFTGSFITETVPRTDIFLALDICTYRREKYLFHNMQIIKKRLWENNNSPLYHKLQVLVADNGNSVSLECESEWIHIYPNKNAGGAAGFTRGLLETMREGMATHVILMDDDVEIMPTAIEKTYVILTLLKEEYFNAMIGGAMLRRDYPFVQQESGARYRMGRISSLHSGFDLRQPEIVLKNEKEEDADYNAWWYCCIPVEVVRKNGFPLPLFIHNDDVEYGLRCGVRVILMNGICVWHEAFEQKRPSTNEYYDVRNALIVNALYYKEYTSMQAIKMVVRRMLTNLFRYRYKDIMLNQRAVLDFLRGPAWLVAQDAEKLHREIQIAGYCYTEKFAGHIEGRGKTDLTELLAGRCNSNQIQKKRLLSLNGWLLPARKNTGVTPIMAGESPHRYYREKKVWIYDPDTCLGFYTEKKIGELFRTVGKVIKCSFCLLKMLKKIRGLYIAYAGDMCTAEFWNQYLGLKGE